MRNEINKKNTFQDVVPPKRSIRDVELPSRRIAKEKTSVAPEKVFETPTNIPKPAPAPMPVDISKVVAVPKLFSQPEQKPEEFSYKYEYDEPKKSPKKWLYISVGVFVVALAFGISALFKSAKITITPKHQTYALNANFTAQKDAATDNGLAYQVVTISKDIQKNVPATGQKEVDTKATGQIVIFNNYSSAPQKLVATTRFQTPEGLIFRLVSAVTVPGQQTSSGKTVAGSVEATVAADVVGDQYNIGLEDFVIPGFKGDPKYSKIYGRSKTVMDGGFSGMQKVVSPDIASSTDADLENSLKTSLATDIVSQIPANFVLYPDSLSYTFSPSTQASSSDNGAVLDKKGTASGIIFDKGSLSRAIVGNILPDDTIDIIKVTNLEKLKFAYESGQLFDPAGRNTTLNFTLSGNPDFVWVFDENKLKSDLLGLSKTQARQIISGYGSISEVWLETSPFWNQIIPKDPQKVTLINTLAQ